MKKIEGKKKHKGGTEAPKDDLAEIKKIVSTGFGEGTYLWAAKKLEEGYVVSRKANPQFHICTTKDISGDVHSWWVTAGNWTNSDVKRFDKDDLFATDWIILEKPILGEVIKILKKRGYETGKTVKGLIFLKSKNGATAYLTDYKGYCPVSKKEEKEIEEKKS